MRRRARAAILVAISSAAGCGGFLGFGSDDENPTPNALDDAASGEGSMSSEGSSNITVDTGVSVDALAGDAADDVMTRLDAMTLGDGRVCVPPGVCTVSVFDCCTEMEDESASSCEGLCGVDICCD